MATRKMIARNAAHKGDAAAQAVFESAVAKLADARDVLERVERGDTRPYCSETWSMWARMTVAEAGKEIERELIRLKLVRSNSPYFVNDR